MEKKHTEAVGRIVHGQVSIPREIAEEMGWTEETPILISPFDEFVLLRDTPEDEYAALLELLELFSALNGEKQKLLLDLARYYAGS